MKTMFTPAPPSAPTIGTALAAARRHRQPEARGELADQVADYRRSGVERPVLQRRRGDLGGHPVQRRARRVVAQVGTPAAAPAAEREHLEAGEPALDPAQILALVAGDLGW